MDDSQLLLKNQICFPIYSVSRLITKAYKPYLDKMGITYPQYLVLMVLWENDNIAVNQISEKLMLNTNTLSPLLQRMEKMDIVQRKRTSEDERCVHVQLTEKGKRLKTNAALIPDELIKLLMTEEIKLEEVLKMKDVLNEWIKMLSDKKE
jgi:DNA-binding MarR family transcriptional regulator